MEPYKKYPINYYLGIEGCRIGLYESTSDAIYKNVNIGRLYSLSFEGELITNRSYNIGMPSIYSE